tara:strand:- start:710 stop:958 length:249 start_codon:yes stop_codon:yes gene_type:complete
MLKALINIKNNLYLFMNKNQKYKIYLKKINQIEKTRQKNNRNWMDLLRLSFKYNPDESKKILREIFKEDRKVNKLVKDILKK